MVNFKVQSIAYLIAVFPVAAIMFCISARVVRSQGCRRLAPIGARVATTRLEVTPRQPDLELTLEAAISLSSSRKELSQSIWVHL